MLQISAHSAICNESPPSFAAQMRSLSKNDCFPILCRVSEAGVGADAYIGPPRSCEFATDYRKKRCNLPGRCGHRPLHRNGQCMRMCRSFSQNQLHSAGRTESSTPMKQNDIDRDRTSLTRWSFAAQMPPPLIMQGMTRGRLGCILFCFQQALSIYLYNVTDCCAHGAGGFAGAFSSVANFYGICYNKLLSYAVRRKRTWNANPL